MIIDAILSPAEIDLLPQIDLCGTVCVVFDVLRATSTIITALAYGATEIYPARTIDEALALKIKFPDAVLGGERFGDKIEGFDAGNSPLEYRNLSGRRIITTTTNGTIALRACERADHVLVGSLLNIDVVIERLKELSPPKIVLVCAGTFREVALEDMIAAGAICANLSDSVFGDSAIAALKVFEAYKTNFLRGLEESRNGRALILAGRQADVAWCAQASFLKVLGEMKSGLISCSQSPNLAF